MFQVSCCRVSGRLRCASYIVRFIRPFATDNVRDLTQALIELFGLTIAEAEFAVALHKNCDLTITANALGTRIDSARTRLKLVFDKTDVHSQQALIRLITDLGAVLGS